MTDAHVPTRRALVIIPTYNERDNIELIVARVRAAAPQAHVLVADDNSPDGTGKVAEAMAADDERLHVLHRPGKDGLGAAYVAGFAWGIEQGYEVLVELDADGSHPPERLPALLAALRSDANPDGADLAIGSRWVVGGSVVNWPKSRELLSRGASVYARLALGISTRDATAGYRAFLRETLVGIDFADVVSKGYCFQIDLTRRTLDAGYRIAEVPITFVERERGESKMSSEIVREALWRVTEWGVAHRWAQARRLIDRGAREPGPDHATPDTTQGRTTQGRTTQGRTTQGRPR